MLKLTGPWYVCLQQIIFASSACGGQYCCPARPTTLETSSCYFMSPGLFGVAGQQYWQQRLQFQHQHWVKTVCIDDERRLSFSCLRVLARSHAARLTRIARFRVSIAPHGCAQEPEDGKKTDPAFIIFTYRFDSTLVLKSQVLLLNHVYL